MARQSGERALEDLHARLRARRPEIQAALLTRALALPGPATLDPEYADGLRAAVCVALDYGLATIEQGEELAPSTPPQLLAQARLAARSDVSLDTVLRRYVAGHVLLTDFLIAEAEAQGLRRAELQRVLRAQAAILDRLLASIGEAYTDEQEHQRSSTGQRDVERIERLLAGEALDTSQIAYDFKGHHLGAIAKGPGAGETLRALAGSLRRRLLLVERDEATIWAWIGGRDAFESHALRGIDQSLSQGLSLALGEPARGLDGWRLTHRQARAAFSIAIWHPQALLRYAEVALLASNFQDDLLATSLRQLYLLPLEQERDGGEVARETLRAYFAAERNVSSAAALLGVSRRTVSNRLGAIEARIGRPIGACAAELEAALRLLELGRIPEQG